jgi:hypothetical protein
LPGRLVDDGGHAVALEPDGDVTREADGAVVVVSGDDANPHDSHVATEGYKAGRVSRLACLRRVPTPPRDGCGHPIPG